MAPHTIVLLVGLVFFGIVHVISLWETRDRSATRRYQVSRDAHRAPRA